MREHQPVYPPEAYTGPDTVVDRATFNALLDCVRCICRDLGGTAHVGTKSRTGWTRLRCQGIGYPVIELPPVADEAP